MPDLVESLYEQDLGHLAIIASLWDIPLNAPDAHRALSILAAAMLDPGLIEETLSSLEPAARQALAALQRSGGRMPWAQFVRQHGALREMGAARRDRQRPYLNSASPVEALWYRGLVGRAFFDASGGLREFAYIPSDLLALLPEPPEAGPSGLGRPATAAERAHLTLASDRVLDHAATLLAALRLGLPAPEVFSGPAAAAPLTSAALTNLLAGAGLLDEKSLPLAEPTRTFLETKRGAALAALANAWLESSAFNDLRLTPGLSAEGEWQNDALATRRAVLRLLSGAPGGTWRQLPAFIAGVRQHQPDFQRPAGDYDSWYLRDTASGEFLRGFAHWDAVEGALLRFIITGPLHWLGLCDLAAPAPETPALAFRFSAWAEALLAGQAPEGLPEEQAPLKASSDGRLFAPPLLPRAVRYQIARFCEWEKERPEFYQYRLTPTSLERARQQGLSVAQLLGLLRRHAAALPPSLVRALERWDQQGSAAHLERALVLRLASPDILQALRVSRAARFLGEPLGPAAVVVKPGAGEKVLAILAEMGYLGELKEK